ncbi:MAG: DUF2007 domain-containing protein [Bacteroidales bacterium]
MKTKTLITCNNIQEAYFIKDILTNEGIQSFTTNENFTNMLPIYNGMLGAGVQVIVDELDYEQACFLIADKIEGTKKDLKVCPECKSEDIRFGYKSKRFSKLLFLILSLVSFLPMKNLQPKYYCCQCGEEL